MKKHAIATIILTLALASLCRPSALQAGESFHFKGQGANASFYHTDECISTSVYVFASDSVSKDQSGPPTSSSWGNVGIDQWNDCTYEPVRSGYGYAALADADLQVNSNLSAATLTATIPVYDYAAGSSFDVRIELAWMGSGERSQGSSHNHYRSPGYAFHDRYKGTFQSAEASGIVAIDGNNLIAAPSGYAYMFSAKSGSVQID